LLACDTLLPVIGLLPVIWHTLDMFLLQSVSQLMALFLRVAERFKFKRRILYQNMA